MKGNLRRRLRMAVATATVTVIVAWCGGGARVEAAESGAGLKVRAVRESDRITVYAGSSVFTEYLYPDDAKYPYFFPVNGPASGASVTVRATEPYPHHSSLFFGCDRVNGGNYWQEGLDRGRIVSKTVELEVAEGEEVVIRQECRWERPGGDPPFRDLRRIVIRAPSATRREIDFEVELTALGSVKILKTNHSLFSARVTPELSVAGGGRLINAEGDSGEAATFGKRSNWMDYRGERDGITEGISILVHSANRWSPPPWFTRDYGFVSPTPMNWLEGDALEFASGERLRLRYRVLVSSGAVSVDELRESWERWVEE